MQVELIVPKDQYETPAEIWRAAVRMYGLDRDAHASPLNAVLPAYDSPSAPGPVAGSRYWINPAYGSYCRDIGEALSRYVWQQGCTVVALLPALVNQPWWHELVMHADSIRYVRSKLKFGNTFLDVTGAYFYSYVVVEWKPTRAAEPPHWAPFEPEPAGEHELLRVRRCAACGKYRLLPRHQVAEPVGPFVCSALADPTRASCGAPSLVWRWEV